MPSSSIQSFYQKETLSSPPRPPHMPPKPHKPDAPRLNDGYAPAEADASLRPLTQTWKPQGTYKEKSIGDLQLGPAKVRFMGRIVNFSTATDDRSKRSLLPQGFHFLVVRDNTGTVAVKLLATDNDNERLRLGKLVTVWTTFVSEYSSATSSASATRFSFVSMIVTVHPSSTSSSCIKFHQEPLGSRDLSLCRLPLDYVPGSKSSSAMPGLMNLKAYMAAGYDSISEARLLVCVSSVGPRKSFKSDKIQGNFNVVEVLVFDETADCIMKLWEDKVGSAKAWIPNKTTLLITSPSFSPPTKKASKGELGIGISTMIDVDPAFPDADWLHRFAASRMKQESVYIPFPTGIWDVEEAINGFDGALFTLADIDDFVRGDAKAIFTGKLNLMVFSVRIIEQYRQRRLCCYECCGQPLYSNKPRATCWNCRNERSLSLNPRIIGSLADETGSIAAGKLIWSDEAWSELFYGNENSKTGEKRPTNIDAVDLGSSDHHGIARSWRGLTDLETESLGDVEDMLQYARFTLTFGWFPAVGRLCVLGVEW
ncbi:hypothetical protein B0T22DRAFT_196272 [Podospora appendiculata]|uniref:Uncharacterized protein n=1 Tax=Podospora appendiculata TaxID=314037 RepID=A0AAE0X439_9PEZI|nr:hypothetical protein B0T22DRAFT_196272 [Podospora appendiculata]